MVSGSSLVSLMGQKQVRAAASLHGLLFLISCPQALPSPNKMRLLVKEGWPPPGVGLGQGRVSKMDICVSDSVGGSIRAFCCFPPYPLLHNSYLKLPTTLPEVTSRLTMKHT